MQGYLEFKLALCEAGPHYHHVNRERSLSARWVHPTQLPCEEYHCIQVSRLTHMKTPKKQQKKEEEKERDADEDEGK